MSIYSYKSSSPVIDLDSYVNEDATVIGTCIIGPGSSVWPGAVIRADNDTVSIGENVNVQDGAVIHVDIGHPATLHNGVSIGHMAMVHGATIGENTLVGMQAVVLNDAVVGKNCIIGANAVVTSGTVVPDNSLVIGSPGKIIRQVTDDEVQGNMRNALHYKQKSVDYKTYLVKLL